MDKLEGSAPAEDATMLEPMPAGDAAGPPPPPPAGDSAAVAPPPPKRKTRATASSWSQLIRSGSAHRKVPRRLDGHNNVELPPGGITFCTPAEIAAYRN
jgi:hypothetical protein